MTDTAICSTEPPNVMARSLKRRIGEMASSLIMPAIKFAARPYLGGETVADALCAAASLSQKGFSTSFSYWDMGREGVAGIESLAAGAIAAIAPAMQGSYLSLKPPALRFSTDAAVRLASLAATHDLRLHFDSHGADVVDRQNAMLEAMLKVAGPERLGTTLPARLGRTRDDAEWAIDCGLNVRVVKGEWPDPADPHPDLNARFLEVIDILAGHARHVAVATHDLVLGREAIARLKARGTSCEIEVLLGMPAQSLIDWAKTNGVAVRVYVPYGLGFIVNAMGVLRRNPRLALTIARAQVARLFAPQQIRGS